MTKTINIDRSPSNTVYIRPLISINDERSNSIVRDITLKGYRIKLRKRSNILDGYITNFIKIKDINFINNKTYFTAQTNILLSNSFNPIVIYDSYSVNNNYENIRKTSGYMNSRMPIFHSDTVLRFCKNYDPIIELNVVISIKPILDISGYNKIDDLKNPKHIINPIKDISKFNSLDVKITPREENI